MISVEEIKKNYKEFSDSKIENIARNESKGLRKEILGILKDEIVKRNLDDKLITWIDAETNTLTEFEKRTLINKIEKLDCPNCGQNRSKLSGNRFTTIISFIIFNWQTTNNRILCDYCAKNKRIESLLTTLLFGWWSPKGLFLTPYTLISKLINSSANKTKINNQIISEFLEENNGMFRLHGTENETLFNLISWHNNNYEIPETEEETEIKFNEEDIE